MNFIVALDKNNGIGNKNKLLIHLPEDLKFFKKTTWGKVLVMGRETLESLPDKKPLPGRTTIVITSRKDYMNNEAVVVNSLSELFEKIKLYKSEDVFVAGGESVYQQLIPYCEYGYITYIDKEFQADKHLMAIDKMKQWEKIWQSEPMDYKGTDFIFTKYKNRNALKY